VSDSLKFSNISPIAIVVAMDVELSHLLDRVTVDSEQVDRIWKDQFATIAGLPVVMTKCGIGIVSAAAATERVINKHQPSAVLNFGCAGAHRRDIMPGDVIIGDRVVHHNRVHILASGEERYMGFGYQVGDENVESADIAAAPTWLAAAERAACGKGLAGGGASPGAQRSHRRRGVGRRLDAGAQPARFASCPPLHAL
jgi:nucleoside phosphorylase